MSTFLSKIIGDKQDWKAMEARADALPRDYRIVYDEMKSYLWKFTSGDGMDIVALLKAVLELFETSAAQGRRALEVTGEDIAAFCDARLQDASSSFVDRWRTTLNRDVARKLAD